MWSGKQRQSEKCRNQEKAYGVLKKLEWKRESSSAVVVIGHNIKEWRERINSMRAIYQADVEDREKERP